MTRRIARLVGVAACALVALLGAPASASAVQATSPPDGSHVVPTPTLTWTLDFLEQSTQVVVRTRRGDASSTVLLAPVAGTATSYDVTAPLPPGAYFWHVEAVGLFGPATTSERSFTVDAPPPPPPPTPPPPPKPPPGPTPCSAGAAPGLLCPDLAMGEPSHVRIDRSYGRARLLSTSHLESLGAGPIEIRGHRRSASTMSVEQLIQRRHGSPLRVLTSARLDFKTIPGQGHYWKLHDAARLELWALDRARRPTRMVRASPKLDYCLRDLQHPHPRRARSPTNPHFPGCNQNRATRTITLGTSVGWSDVYPATYYQQWINVRGLHGRFGLVHVADPDNHLVESNERNNSALRIVRLP